jgi:hypothetical protein
MISEFLFGLVIGFLFTTILFMLLSGEWLVNDFQVQCPGPGQCFRIQRITEKAAIDYLRSK